MQEFVKEYLELRIYGREVKLSRPTWGQTKKLKEAAQAAKDAGTSDVQDVEKLLVELGLPQDLLDEMDIHHVKTLQELLLTPKKN